MGTCTRTTGSVRKETGRGRQKPSVAGEWRFMRSSVEGVGGGADLQRGGRAPAVRR